MSDFKTRLITEESELLVKIEKLYDFTQDDKFGHIDKEQRVLLQIQLNAMRTYWQCLTARIEAM